MITIGAVDRTVHAWISDECGRSTVKNSLAILVRVMEQAVQDGIITHNPARVRGWQQQYKQAEDELGNPRALALPDWAALVELAAVLVERSSDRYEGWGEVVIFAACTAARIGEVSGVRVGDIDRDTWTWTVRRQTTPSPGGVVDKGTKGKRARTVPLIEEIRPMVARRLDSLAGKSAPGCSPAVAAAASCCGTPRTGTKWSPSWAMSIYGVRSTAHRADLDGRCRCPGARPPEDRRAWITEHDTAVSAASIAAAGEALSVHLSDRRSPDGPRLRAV